MTRRPYAAAARDLLRTTILDAVDELARARGWSATTMADVAGTAGVSRQTLYNEFGSRPALVEAYVTHEIEAIMRDVGDAVRLHADDAHQALRGAFELFLKLASDEPIVQLVQAGSSPSESGDDSLMRLLTTIGQTYATQHVAALVVEIWPQVTPSDAELLAGSLVRLAISHALVPVQDPGVAATGVGRMVAPFVDQIIA